MTFTGQTEVSGLQEARYITIISNRRKIVLNVSTILYALKVDKCIEIHVSGERVYDTE